ncbi:MAG: phosphoenolpyruvate--protein phosphotransferase [Phycisphaerae bacterium]|nr:phosphoenolpyruvate--protein phosphotransferase [Phycisphaerae bacterium]
MEIRKGIGVSPGVAIASAFVLETEEFRVPRRTITPEQVDAELARLDRGLDESQAELEELRRGAVNQLGTEAASIFDFHLGMLRDRSLLKQIRETVTEKLFTAEYAVATVLRAHAKAFLQMSNSVLPERVRDIYDLEKRLLRHLLGERRETLEHLTEDVVVVAHDLTPSQTASLVKSRVMGFATDAGGRTSHTAIVARALSIPAVVGVADISRDVAAGDTVIIDGNRGVVIINPDELTLEEHRRYIREYTALEQELDELRTVPALTKDGVHVRLMGNIEFPNEVETALEKGGDGIGLYRTEFLYLGSEREPTEEEHYKAYEQAIVAVRGKPIILRTLDLGADKWTQRQREEPERNPFLGLRSIRFCLQNLPLFRTQLRAMLRASVLGDMRIMLPLITSALELRQAKIVMGDVMEDLEEERIPFNRSVKLGIMIETPAAALTAPTLAKESDFFSIGTNDLIQYTLAVDRTNERVAPLFTAANPAVIKMIKDILKVGRRQGIDVSLCGEMAGEPEYTILLLGLGLRAFSMTPPRIPQIKRVIRSVTLEKAMKITRRVMTFDTDRQILNYLREETRRVAPKAFG